MIVNAARADASEREMLSELVESRMWKLFVDTAEEDIIGPLRTKALTDPRLDPREHTGIVMALQKVQALIMLPYERLARAAGKPVQDILPERIARLFA